MSGLPFRGPDPKEKPRGERKYRRQVASPARWARIRDAKLTECRVCSGASGLHLTLHHLVPKGRGLGAGSDTEANCVPLCGTGTSGCHGKVEHRDPDAVRVLLEKSDRR